MSAKRLRVAVGLLAVIALSPVALPAQDEGIDLRPRWVTGQRTYAEVKWERSAETTVREEGIKRSSSRQKIVEVWGFWHTVESVSPEGAAKIRLTFDRVSVWINGGDSALKYNSDIDRPDDKSPLCVLLRPLLGVSFALEVGASGEVTSFTGGAALKEKLAALKPDKRVLEHVRHVFDGDWHELLWKRLLACYPFKQTVSGDLWYHDFGYEAPPAQYTYRFSRIRKTDDRQVAVVPFSASRASEFVPPDTLKPGESRHERGELRCHGLAIHDLQAGYFWRIHERREYTERKSRRDADGKLTVEVTDFVVFNKNLLMSEEKRKEQKASAAQRSAKDHDTPEPQTEGEKGEPPQNEDRQSASPRTPGNQG